MTDYSKIQTYPELVKAAQHEYKRRLQDGTFEKFKKVKYVPCKTWEKSNQINLWTFFQGCQLYDSLGKEPIDILLVGQDWGNPSSDNVSIIKIENGSEVTYNEYNPSDRNLIKMFDVLDLHIDKENSGSRIFFTNYSLGYREGSETGGMTKGMMKLDSDAFDALVRIIKPKNIICLGKIVYEMVTGNVVKGFLNTMKSGKCLYTDMEGIKVFGVPHPGARGLNNLGTGNEAGNIAKMEEIWRAVKHRM